MVAVEQMHGAACCRRLLLQPLQEVQYLDLLGAPVQHIPHLHQHRAAAHPAFALVDQLCQAQRSTRLLEVAMQIAQGHDALGGRR